jgi:RND family efflux transporter MFP subunit
VAPVKLGIRSAIGIVLLGVVVVLGTTACGEKGQSGSGMAMGGRRGPSIPVVEIEEVAVGTIARHVTVSGIVEPIRMVGIKTQISGAILAIEAQEGDLIRAGSILARLDDRELRAQEASAAASHEMALANYERSKLLRERQVITAAEYDRDRTALAAAAAQLEQLRTRLGYTVIRAPITGLVTEKWVEAGDIVGVQTRLFALADVDTMVVRVHVSELDVVELGTGDAVAVMLDAYPGQPLTGRIRRIFPAADPTTRLVPVEVALRQDGERLARSGFLARIEFALGARTDVLLVPASAVVGDASSASVFIVQDGVALRRSVRTGLNSEGHIEILTGIEAGDPVIVAGNNGLRDGAQVRVVGLGATMVDDSGAQRASAVGGGQ